jgi:hypothetical protein
MLNRRRAPDLGQAVALAAKYGVKILSPGRGSPDD